MSIIGTGFVVDPQGIIITAGHVVTNLEKGLDEYREKQKQPNASPVVITFGEAIVQHASAEKWQMRMDVRHHGIVRAIKHNGHDIAAVRVKPARPLPTVRLDFERNHQEGDTIMACGFPHGLRVHEGKSIVSSFLTGIISAIAPHHIAPPHARAHYLLQLPANPGNSGGPVFDPISGCVLGVVSRGFAPNGMGSGLTITVPIHPAHELIKKL